MQDFLQKLSRFVRAFSIKVFSIFAPKKWIKEISRISYFSIGFVGYFQCSAVLGSYSLNSSAINLTYMKKPYTCTFFTFSQFYTDNIYNETISFQAFEIYWIYIYLVSSGRVSHVRWWWELSYICIIKTRDTKIKFSAYHNLGYFIYLVGGPLCIANPAQSLPRPWISCSSFPHYKTDLPELIHFSFIASLTN